MLGDIDKKVKRVSGVCTEAMGSNPGRDLFYWRTRARETVTLDTS